MTRKQLEGLQHCPDKRVREAVASALAYSQRAEDAEAQVRELQERLAAKEQDCRILVILHRDGHVELWSKHKLPVKFAHWHDLGKGGDDEAEEYMRGRLPELYRSIYDSDEGKRIGAGSCKGCLSRGEFRYVQSQLAAIEAVKELEGGAKP
jgi:HEAT repeat protein